MSPSEIAHAASLRKLFIDVTFLWDHEYQLNIGLEPKNLYYAKLASKYKVGYSLLPGEGGVLVLSLEPSRTTLPASADKLNVQQFKADGTDQVGYEYNSIVMDPNKSGTVILYGSKDLTSDVDIVRMWAEETDLLARTVQTNIAEFSEVRSHIAGVFDSMKSMVILPAGNLFTFKNVEPDAASHVYTGVTYRSTATLERTQ